MTETKSDLLENANRMAAELVQIRRDIHAHPELSFKETRTAAAAGQHLVAAGFEVRGRFVETGFYVDFGDNPTVAIRCEMDALSMPELNLNDYRSTIANAAHACGHDAHVACVIGAARLLAGNSKKSVRIVLQPGEEKLDADGVSGAAHVIASGALDGITTIVGIHVDPTIPTGKVSILPIPTERRLEFLGRAVKESTFAAVPDLVRTLVAMEQVSVSHITANAQEIVVTGSLLDHGDDVAVSQTKIESLFSQIEWNTSREGSAVDIDAAALVASAEAVLGASNATLSKRKSWSYSLTEYSRHVAAVLLLVGCEMRGDRRSQHTGKFDIDENCLPVGAAALTAIVDSM